MSLILEAARLGSRPRVRIAAAAGAFAILSVITYLIGHPRMFTGFANYDDEGYMLVALESFLDHGSLYDDVFSQYGPFYFEAWGAVFSIFGLPVTHDVGRSATLFAWVGSSLLVGAASWRMTGSILLGLATQTLVFGGIVSLTNEPMHPGGIICLLLAVIVGLSCLVGSRSSPGAMGLLGGAVMALILIKINVGMFALASLALACAVSFPALLRRRWLRPLVEVGFVATPVLLMASKMGDAWARHYAVHVAVAALALVIVLRTRFPAPRASVELRWLVSGLIAVALTTCVVILATGTSPSALFDGVLKQPLNLPGAFSIPLGLADRIYLFDLLALTAAFAYWYVARTPNGPPSPAWASTTSLLSILIGVGMALSVVGKTTLFDTPGFIGIQLGLLSFAWVALIPVPGGGDERAAFARLFLPFLVVLQALHAFPVAGSQVQWSAFLLIPVGAICVANGVRGLALSLSEERERRGLGVLGGVVATVAMAVLINLQLKQPLNEARAAYDGAVSLNLPGSTTARVSQAEAELYGRIAEAIDANCPAFLTLPGMNSFYLWTGQEPPSGYNASGWTTVFNDDHQRRVIDDTRSIEGLCLLQNIPIAEGWGIPDSLLVRYLHRGFRPLASFGDYELLQRATLPDRRGLSATRVVDR